MNVIFLSIIRAKRTAVVPIKTIADRGVHWIGTTDFFGGAFVVRNQPKLTPTFNFRITILFSI